MKTSTKKPTYFTHPDFSAAKIEKKVRKLHEQIRYLCVRRTSYFIFYFLQSTVVRKPKVRNCFYYLSLVELMVAKLISNWLDVVQWMNFMRLDYRLVHRGLWYTALNLMGLRALGFLNSLKGSSISVLSDSSKT